MINLAVARDLGLEPFRERVCALRADAVQSARILVCALSEFSARVQIRQHQLNRGHLPFRMNVDRNAAAVVAHRDRSVDVDDHFDLCAKSCEMFVDRVIENFVNQVMQSAFVRISNKHSRPFADCFETFELVDLRRVVFLR